MMDGLALAEQPVVELDVAFVNLDDRESEVPERNLTSWEREVIARWWQTARFDTGGSGREPLPAEEILIRLGRSRYFSGIPSAELRATLAAMDSFLFEGKAAERVLAAIEPDTELIIGHALGAVAAYNALCRTTAESLITVGSPLALNPQGVPGVRRWDNLVDVYDTLAFNEGLAPHYPQACDSRLDCDPRLRAPRPYLASPEFGRILADALAPAVAHN